MTSRSIISAIDNLSEALLSAVGGSMCCCSSADYYEIKSLAIDILVTAASGAETILLVPPANHRIVVTGGRLTAPILTNNATTTDLRVRLADGDGPLEGWTYLPGSNYVLPPTDYSKPHLKAKVSGELLLKHELLNATTEGYIGGFITYAEIPA